MSIIEDHRHSIVSGIMLVLLILVSGYILYEVSKQIGIVSTRCSTIEPTTSSLFPAIGLGVLVIALTCIIFRD